MRYAVLSDIHANLEALRAVLADCRAEVDAVLCLGDLVGYGADPAACVELLDECAPTLVAGNHDCAVTGRLDLEWFNPVARAAAEWTTERLDEAQSGYLAALPLRASVADATLVHASPARPGEWEYLTTAEDGVAAFEAFETQLCFVGHSHQPGHWSIGASGPAWRPGAGDIAFENGRRYIVNVGSVGQPRDRDSRACYAVWDRATQRVTFRRVTYDVWEARRKIVAAGLPRFLADRLRNGT